jgi:uncharacterized membrane protein YkvA (DUF1232 family)
MAGAEAAKLDERALDGYADVMEQYVRDTVDLLEACSMAANQAGIGALVDPILAVATQYFLQPLDFIPDEAGLYGLLDDAYLARSLIAQVSELYRHRTGVPLVPFDLVPDNVTVRAVIGEPVATQLDRTVAGTLQNAVVQQSLAGLYGHNSTLNGFEHLSATGGPGSWGGCVEDEIARLGAECGISING